MRNHSLDVSSQLNFHFVQLESGRSFRLTEFEKIVRLSPQSHFQCYFPVQDRRTLELCLARWWSSVAPIETSYSLEFHSLVIHPSLSIHLSSSQAYQRLLLENRSSRSTEEILGLPTIQWKSLVQTLRPNKEESRIQLLSFRDCFPQERQISQLILVYHFTLVSSFTLSFSSLGFVSPLQLKASEVTVKCPYLHELLYDNEFEAALWMCFDANKQYLGAGDVIKDVRRREKPSFDPFLRSSVFFEIREGRFPHSNERSTRESRTVGTTAQGKRRHGHRPASGTQSHWTPSDWLLSFARRTDRPEEESHRFVDQVTRGTGTSSLFDHCPGRQVTLSPEDQPRCFSSRLPKVISSLNGTFLRGTMTFPIDEKMKKMVRENDIHSLISSSSSSSSS